MEIANSVFNNVCRIGSDGCDLTNKNIENINAANYLLENYNLNSSMDTIISLATNQPNIFFSGGNVSGNNIDENNDLKFSSNTRTRERNPLDERLFLTVPYLGKGPGNVHVESEIKRGDSVVYKKSLDPNSEISHINYNFYPLLPSLEATLTNPANLVEGVAAEGWVRGGVPTRELNHE